MRRILIVGAGQSGLQLGLCLLQHDYDVTIMTARTADELALGRAVSVQLLTGSQVALERAYGLDLWSAEVPPIRGHHVRDNGGGGSVYEWTGRYREPTVSVDERVKMSVWLDLFERMGGRVIVHPVTTSDLDHLVSMYDLTVIAAGQSGLAEMFPVTDEWMRPLSRTSVTAVAYVTAVEDDPYAELITSGRVPGLGQLTTHPGHSVNGPCRLLAISGPSTSGLGSWPTRMRPQQQLDLMLEAMREHLPQLYEVYGGVRLVDRRAVTMDYSSPLMRDPVATLPSGGKVLGIGDTVIAPLPAFGQNANNECRSAAVYLKAILEHGDRPFDEDFMRAAFAGFEEFALPFYRDLAVVFGTVPPHFREVLEAGSTCQAVADRFARGFDDPVDMASWLVDENAARAYLAEATGGNGSAEGRTAAPREEDQCAGF